MVRGPRAHHQATWYSLAHGPHCTSKLGMCKTLTTLLAHPSTNPMTSGQVACAVQVRDCRKQWKPAPVLLEDEVLVLVGHTLEHALCGLLPATQQGVVSELCGRGSCHRLQAQPLCWIYGLTGGGVTSLPCVSEFAATGTKL